ncbi:hypothetical protein BU24DRAFT_413919 [Aaosphaeria arxii CBS 175.79]|uniref:Regulator of phospholipase D SRF1 n=1 Tax=Aaosphaeria arxii CBS 175.79 TaxID=1450172 RepID=A0A6A5XC07_9PLEO|nr:uncharacterized protein BU24DRAFT_413919 [Aaosphaeria arxii CBS 175.79]KAF2010314.1 hypothetical protein BU24DRAFT_413919 [Aaosphaeria arxii CBS 175.79]
MPGQPMVDHNNGTPIATSRSSHGHLLPSALPPPPSSSSAHSPRPLSGVSGVSSINRDRASEDLADGAAVRKSHSHSISSNPHTLASSKGSTAADNRDRQRAVRTLPPWVQSAEEDENADPTSLLLPRTPTSIRPASHNHMPTPKANAVAGRHFDHVREGTPVTITSPVAEHASKWQQFAKASDYDYVRPPTSNRGQVVDDEWMKENMPDLETPWDPIDKDEEEEDQGWWLLNASKRRRRIIRTHRVLMNHPMVPAAFRLTVLAFSCLALGLAGSIFDKSTTAGCENNSSTWLALIVDIVAIVYTTYITYDEYTSKPLGLRSHNAKMRLIFMDLFFIVFDSANLSLAFQALTDERWACEETEITNFCRFSRDICVRQKALTATLLIALVAWLMTFAISTLRLIERVAR